MTARAALAGWHGKLPCRPDFVGGGAQGRLVEGWRRWALEGLAAIRAGGDAARDAFLIAPIWRFAARAPLFGTAGYGLIAPGADSGGRLFPVIAAVETPVADPDEALNAAAAWLDRAEEALRAALDPAAAPDALTAALANPPAAPGGGGGGGGGGEDAAFAAGAQAARRGARGPASPALFATLFARPSGEAPA